jgi:hypothetical protein
MTTQSWFLRLALLLVLSLAACAAGSSADGSASARTHGFYGGVSGGWTHP